MKKIKPWLLIFLVFIAGIFVGVLGARFVIRRALDPNFVRNRIERELTRELALWAEQRVKVHQALLDSQGELKSLRVEIRPRIAAVLEKSREDIALALTPEQREKFEKYVGKKRAELNLMPALRPR